MVLYQLMVCHCSLQIREGKHIDLDPFPQWYEKINLKDKTTNLIEEKTNLLYTCICMKYTYLNFSDTILIRMIYNKDEYAKQPDSQNSYYWPLICLKKSNKINNSYLGWVDVVIDVTKLDSVYYWVIVTNIHKHGWKEF